MPIACATFLIGNFIKANKMKKIDMVGKTYGKWYVIKEDGYLYGRPAFLCRCECGTTQRVSGNEIRRGKTKGCQKCKYNIFNNKSYSDYPEYTVYNGIKQRCYNINNEKYKDYGGRGIKMCERWLVSFENFYNDMGGRPSNEYSIDRINVDGDYCKENCRWATIKEQNNNRRPKESKYICWHKRKCWWQVKVKDKYVGTFKNIDEAIKARNYYITKNNLFVRLKDDKFERSARKTDFS